MTHTAEIDAAREALATVLAEHQLVGVTIWNVECSCGKQEGVDYYAHTADALVAAVRDLMAGAFDDGYECCVSDGTPQFHNGNPYRDDEEPAR